MFPWAFRVNLFNTGGLMFYQRVERDGQIVDTGYSVFIPIFKPVKYCLFTDELKEQGDRAISAALQVALKLNADEEMTGGIHKNGTTAFNKITEMFWKIYNE